MCPWRVNEAHVTMILSYRTNDIRVSDIPHPIGKLYRRHITSWVGFTWEGCPRHFGTNGSPTSEDSCGGSVVGRATHRGTGGDRCPRGARRRGVDLDR